MTFNRTRNGKNRRYCWIFAFLTVLELPICDVLFHWKLKIVIFNQNPFVVNISFLKNAKNRPFVLTTICKRPKKSVLFSGIVKPFVTQLWPTVAWQKKKKSFFFHFGWTAGCVDIEQIGDEPKWNVGSKIFCWCFQLCWYLNNVDSSFC